MSTTAAAPLLAIETSTSTASVALGTGERLLAEIVVGAAGNHSGALMPAVEAALAWAGLEARDVRGVVVSGGPGSFTGLRIGAATGKGIVHALRLPLWSYSGLLAAAAGLAAAVGAAEPVCALFDARRGEVFAACYRFADPGSSGVLQTVFGPEALPVSELLERFDPAAPPVFTGDGAQVHQTEIRERLRARIAPPHLALPRASALLWLQHADPALGRVAQPERWEPDYLRASGAERIAQRREAS